MMITSYTPHQENQGVRNWLDLPGDVLLLIFKKLGVFGILLNAQWVCSLWYNLSKDPILFRSLDVPAASNSVDDSVSSQLFTKIFKLAVDRSCGQLIEFTSDYDYNRIEILRYALEKSRSIKLLRISFSHYISDILPKIGANLIVLEELELSCLFVTSKVIEEVGRNCLQLKCLRFSCLNEDYVFDDMALAIAQNLPWLHRLELSGTSLTHVGLQAILDQCSCLEYLDLRYCFFVDVKQSLLYKCVERIREVMLPSDITEDHESDVDIDDRGSSTSESSYEDHDSLMYVSSSEE